MFLTARQAAALLRSTERQIYRWVDEREIPFQRVRDQVRFNRTDLLEWATSRGLPISLEAFDANLDPEDRAPGLGAAIRVGGVHLDVPASDRDSALRAVVERTPMPAGLDREFVVEVLIARESTVSTGIGNGIAIPHVRQPVVAPGAAVTVSVSHLRTPIPFGAIDAKPVHTVFLIVTPTVRTHLQMLAQVARALLEPSFQRVLDSRAPTEVLAAAADQLQEETRASAPPAPAPGDQEAD